MWTRRRVPRHKLIASLRRPLLPWLAALPFCLFLLVFPGALLLTAQAEETIVCAVTVNQQQKGEFFVVKRTDGDFLVTPEDLQRMGLERIPSARTTFDNETYVSLRETPEVTFRFDDLTLTLEITANPELLGKSIVDLRYRRPERVYYPRETSFFLNYAVDYTASGASSLEFEDLNISNELGFRIGDGVLLGDALYRETPEDRQWVRLNTRYIRDWRDRMHRLTVGDFVADSGTLGGRVSLAGLSFAKTYQLNPYFIRYPLFDFSGVLEAPSQVELYVDGAKIRSERFAPGTFELLNFQGIRGAQTVEVVIRDAFGREQRVATPVYATDQILSQGLHEYSYNLGFLRRDFGRESNRYDRQPSFSAFHRYGLTNKVNLGGRAEFGERFGNIGLESALIVGSYGLMRLEGAVSSHHGEAGAAGQLTYEYQTPTFNARIGVQSYSSAYRTLADLQIPFDRKLNLFASLGYLSAKLGSFGVRYLDAQRYQGEDRREITFSWSRRLWGRAYLSASVSLVDQEQQAVESLLNFHWRFDRDRAFTAGYRHEDKLDIHRLEIRQDIPAGYGTGWGLQAEHAESEATTTRLLDGFVQHNARHAIVRADAGLDDAGDGTTTRTRLALSGALVYVGGTVGLTRPVRDSFSLVSVGRAEDVRVYVNGQNSGRTGRDGRLFVPDLYSYFENRVSFDDKDIPLDYLMPQVQVNVSPPLRGGSCVNFPLGRYQAVTGTLQTASDGTPTPLADAELLLSSPDGPLTFWTSSKGEFYLDSQMNELDILAAQGCAPASKDDTVFLPAGTYPLTIKQAGATVQTELRIPPSDETFIDLGIITVPQPGTPR